MLPEAGHFDTVARQLSRGRLVPFLGAGANRLGDRQLPTGAELARTLARHSQYPVSARKLTCQHCMQALDADEALDLMRVAQFVYLKHRSGGLYDELDEVFKPDHYVPNDVHSFLAELTQILRDRGYTRTPLLIATTNYDDLPERAMDRSGENYDLLVYEAKRPRRGTSAGHYGKFWHRGPSGTWRIIERPNEEVGLLRDHPVILKVHGAYVRDDPDRRSYVITEDDYTDYRLPDQEISETIPASIARHLMQSGFLFLGYGLRDWNLRVLFRRISDYQKLSYPTWAVQLTVDAIDQLFWEQWGVQIVQADLAEYISQLRLAVERLPKR